MSGNDGSDRIYRPNQKTDPSSSYRMVYSVFVEGHIAHVHVYISSVICERFVKPLQGANFKVFYTANDARWICVIHSRSLEIIDAPLPQRRHQWYLAVLKSSLLEQVLELVHNLVRIGLWPSLCIVDLVLPIQRDHVRSCPGVWEPNLLHSLPVGPSVAWHTVNIFYTLAAVGCDLARCVLLRGL